MAEIHRGLPPRACTFAQRQRHLPEQAERFSVSAAIAWSCDREVLATLPAGPLFSPGQGFLSAEPDRTNRTPLLRFCSLQHLPAKRRHCPKGRQPLEDHPVSALPNSRRLNGGGWLVSRGQLAVLTVFRLTRLTIRAFSSIGFHQRASRRRSCNRRMGRSSAFFRSRGLSLAWSGEFSRRRSWDFPPFAVLLLPRGCRGVSARSRPHAVIRLHPSRSFFIGRWPSCSQTNLSL